jgi:pilus assembly protein Flp/PilA
MFQPGRDSQSGVGPRAIAASFVVARPSPEAEPNSGMPRFGIGQMKKIAEEALRFLADEQGPTAVEYAVMLALIVVVCLAAITSVGTNASTTFNKVSKSL